MSKELPCKELLIHNNNVSNIEDFSENIKFSNSSDLDEYITNEIIQNTDIEKFETIYIKDNLSSNYLELDGLRVAYHIRLSEGVKKHPPIVILSDVDSYTLNKLDPIARILFTKNIFIIKNSTEDIKGFKLPKKCSELTKDNYKNKFLNLITVEPPENSTSHSIANEWAIERWSHLLGIQDKPEFNKNRKKVSSMLYFKYLKQKYISNTNKPTITQNKDLKGKLLFIDDRGSDGWNDIIETYVGRHSKIEFKALKNEYKNIEVIKTSVKKSIQEYDPNIILLDLRLLGADVNESNPDEISGTKILECIKKEDPSIQVIMFTASNDSLILDDLHDKEIFGYVKKDAPTDKSNNNGFEKLGKLITNASEKKYLKEIYPISHDILEILKPESLTIYKFDKEKKENFLNLLKKNTSYIFDVLDSTLENRFNYAMITIATSLEAIVELFYCTKSNDEMLYFCNKHGESDSGLMKKATLEKKLEKIIKQKLNSDIEVDLSNLIKIRNAYMHSNSKYNKVTEKNLIEWFGELKKIINKICKPEPPKEEKAIKANSKLRIKQKKQ